MTNTHVTPIHQDGTSTSGLDAAASSAGGGAASSRRHASVVKGFFSFLGMVPFFAYVIIAMIVPMGAVMILAFKSPTGGFTMANINLMFHGEFLQSFENSLQLALATSIVPGILGVVLAHAIATSTSDLFRRLMASASAVLGNFGGVNLAFIFGAAYGTTGVATLWLSSLGYNPWDHGFNLYGFTGVVFIYMYFQIPLMVLIVTPALGALKESWREASSGLGGSKWTYWRDIGIPVLFPSILGGILLLFGSGLSAFATAQALTSGTVQLVPILIGDFLNGNVVAGQENVGYALGFGMIVILVITIAAYLILQRWATRWQRR